MCVCVFCFSSLWSRRPGWFLFRFGLALLSQAKRWSHAFFRCILAAGGPRWAARPRCYGLVAAKRGRLLPRTKAELISWTHVCLCWRLETKSSLCSALCTSRISDVWSLVSLLSSSLYVHAPALFGCVLRAFRQIGAVWSYCTGYLRGAGEKQHGSQSFSKSDAFSVIEYNISYDIQCITITVQTNL